MQTKCLARVGGTCFLIAMFVRAHSRVKDGKKHVYYSVVESVRVRRGKSYQRRVLYLGELNAAQVTTWQRSCDVMTERGESRQIKLFADRAPVEANDDDVAEVVLSSLTLRNSRDFGECWLGCRLWEELGLDEFWRRQLAGYRGEVPWHKVVELLAVNRLVAPRSELYIHEKWFCQTAMSFLQQTNVSVAEKDRLYRCLDRIVEHKEALEKHLSQRWHDLFGASFDVLLYDITSTYFEGDVPSVTSAKRGYSRDHRGDCKQILVALIVTPEGFPLSYEIFDGNRVDVTTLEEVLDAIERKYGRVHRIWVFDRGIVSEKNLELLRARGSSYIVGTRRSMLRQFEREFLTKDWENISSEVEVKLLPKDDESYILARSALRRKKELAMRRRKLQALRADVRSLQKAISSGRLKSRDALLRRIGVLDERHRALRQYFNLSAAADCKLQWSFDSKTFLRDLRRDGAYLLRTNLPADDPAKLWRQYIQLTEVEASFRALKSELAMRPVWHWTEKRVQAHVMVAFLGYCLWVCLKRRLFAKAPGLTPWQAIEQMQSMKLVEVWFQLRKGGAICLERITLPGRTQQLLLEALGWTLPKQPPPRIYEHMLQNVVQT